MYAIRDMECCVNVQTCHMYLFMAGYSVNILEMNQQIGMNLVALLLFCLGGWLGGWVTGYMGMKARLTRWSWDKMDAI